MVIKKIIIIMTDIVRCIGCKLVIHACRQDKARMACFTAYNS